MLKTKIQDNASNVRLVAVVLFFLLCGVVYAWMTPPFEAPDESSHLMLVRYLSLNRALPPMNPGPSLDSATGSLQSISFSDPPFYYAPPLYYGIAALLTSWTTMDDLPDLLVPNPRHEVGWALTSDTSLTEKNFYAHRFADETWSRSGTVRATYTLRLFSMCLGAVTIVVVYRVVDLLFGRRKWMPLGAAAIIALNPRFIATSAAVSNDNLVNAIFSLFFLVVIHLLRHPASWYHWAGLGGLAGLGLLTKQSAGLLLPLGLWAILWQDQVTWKPDRKAITGGLAFVGASLLVGGWWYLRNAVLYSDPLGMEAHQMQLSLDTFGRSHFLWALDTYFAVFGWSVIRVEPQVYVFFRVCAWVVLGSFCWSMRPGGDLWAQPSATRRVMLFLGVAFVVNAAAFVSWSLATASVLGRLLYSSNVAIAVLAIWGAAQWSSWRRAPYAGAAILAIMATFAVAVPWRYLQPAFASPRLEHVPASAQTIDVRFENNLHLVGYTAPRSDDLSPGQSFEVTLYWRSHGDVEQRYRVWIQLGPWNAYPPLDVIDTWLGGTLYPTDLWQPGDIVQQKVALTVPDWVTEPGLFWIRAGVVDMAGEPVALSVDGVAQDMGPWDPTVGQAAVIGPYRLVAPTTYSPTHSAHYHFGPDIELVGYDYALEVVDDVKHLQVTLFWQSSQPPGTDYLIRVHLVDADGQVAEDRTPPHDGDYPVSWWLPGQLVAKSYIYLPTAAGGYSLRVQLLDPSSQLALSVYDDEGRQVPDRAVILPVAVAEAHTCNPGLQIVDRRVACLL
jgi:4-amino-4-deoxy-L-arabinose transferase-like glycosyltransferase